MAEEDITFENNINHSDYKILIVDDVMSNVLLLKILLTNEKFQVCTASNGNQCIEAANSDNPDLILLDVMMPDISGFETAKILKSKPETADIPIIFLTALNSPSDLVKGFQVGASDFITKPFNKEELVIRVMHQISLVAAKRLISQQNQELKNTIQGRDKLYSVIAHDLRSPMSSVKIVLNMLTMTMPKDVIGEEIFELISQANQQTEEVFSLLDNLLKWTKSQIGKLNVVFQDFSVDELIPGVIEIFSQSWRRGEGETGRGRGSGRGSGAEGERAEGRREKGGEVEERDGKAGGRGDKQWQRVSHGQSGRDDRKRSRSSRSRSTDRGGDRGHRDRGRERESERGRGSETGRDRDRVICICTLLYSILSVLPKLLSPLLLYISGEVKLLPLSL